MTREETDVTAPKRATWAIELPNRDRLPKLMLDQVLWECFRHFLHLDESNAAIHVAPIRYSPITFRLAEYLHAMDVYVDLEQSNAALLETVVVHLGAYEEDRGR